MDTQKPIAKKTRPTANDKGILAGKNAICRLLPISTKSLDRLIEAGEPHPLLEIIKKDAVTGWLWAYRADVERYLEDTKSVADMARSEKRRAARGKARAS